jgi:hypothetical protein
MTLSLANCVNTQLSNGMLHGSCRADSPFIGALHAEPSCRLFESKD